MLSQAAGGQERTVERLKHLFKGIWSLEEYGRPEAPVNDVVELAIANPSRYVLKPQKEGGGNNFFDDELREKLLEVKAGTDANLLSYLVMERICPPVIPMVMLRRGELAKEMS